MEREISPSCRATEAFRHLFVLTCKSASTPFHCFLANDHRVFSHAGVVFFLPASSLFVRFSLSSILCVRVFIPFFQDCGPTAWLACLNLCHSTSMTADDALDFI
jgi:hypothetical protein